MGKLSKRVLPIALFSLIVVLAVTLGVALSLHNQVRGLKSNTGATSPEGPDYVTIYLIKAEPTEFHLVPVQRKIGATASPAAALQALINGPIAHEELHSALPHTARLLSLKIEDGLATADFSAELVSDFNGGALLESYLVTAIVNTLTDFKHIHTVQILVEGRVVESIGGHILVDKPLKRAN